MISEESSTVPNFRGTLTDLRLLDQLVLSTCPFVLLNVNDNTGHTRC